MVHEKDCHHSEVGRGNAAWSVDIDGSTDRWEAAVFAALAVAETYLWIELINAANGVVNIAALDGTSNDHAIENAVRVDERLEATLLAERVRCVFVALDDQVVHYKAIEITVETERRKNEMNSWSASVLGVFGYIGRSPLLVDMHVSIELVEAGSLDQWA